MIREKREVFGFGKLGLRAWGWGDGRLGIRLNRLVFIWGKLRLNIFVIFFMVWQKMENEKKGENVRWFKVL